MTTSKKHFTIAITIFISTLSLQSIAQVKKFHIKGNIKDMTAMPVMTYLYQGRTLTDSAAVNKGQYEFKGEITTVTSATLTIQKFTTSGEYDMLNILLDEGEINLESTGTLRNAIISGVGGQATRDYNEALKDLIKTADSLRAIAATPAFKNDPVLRNHVQVASSNLGKPMVEQMIRFLKRKPQSHAAIVMMPIIASSDVPAPKLVDSLMKTLPVATQAAVAAHVRAENERKTVQLKEIEIRNAKTAIGKKAIDFTQNDVDGKPITLSAYEGKYVLVDFWASWCGPCRAENPAVVKAFNAFKDKGFTILGVSLDSQKNKQDWIDAIAKDGLTWTQVSDLKGFENEAARLYDVTAIPQNFLIDPNGVIVAKNLRGEALENKLKELIQ